MTEFKINRGLSSNLPSTLTDGWIYFCTDTGEFHIDYLDNDNALKRKTVTSLSALQKSGDTMEGVLKFLEGTHYGASAPTTGELGQIFFSEEDADCLQKTGDTMEGTLKLTENVHYGDVAPDTGGEGQVFFEFGSDGDSDVGNLPAAGAPLDEYTWEEISKISAAGMASSYFSVGDCKAVDIKGTVGTLVLDTTLYVYIIGFDHNSTIGTDHPSINTIDFGTFKTAASDGIDVCLIDGKSTVAAIDVYDGTKYFNMNHSASTNSGGWGGCDLRYDILGSTDAKADNASSTTVASPVPNTLMAALPSDLRAVMKPMDIFTDNTGGDTYSSPTWTVDYLPLLGESEVIGGTSKANKNEYMYQERYAYYNAGNSMAKKKHNSTSSVTSWWLRSPMAGSNVGFCAISMFGELSTFGSGYNYGLAPIFRV